MAQGQLSEDVKHFSAGYPFVPKGGIGPQWQNPRENAKFLPFGPPCGPEGRLSRSHRNPRGALENTGTTEYRYFLPVFPEKAKREDVKRYAAIAAYLREKGG